jgi:predicted RNA-binding protein YlqC (UPF0109 family)
MKALLDYIIPNIVNYPDEVTITEDNTPSGIILSIKVHPEDMGRVIGKGGKVIKAIRQIARILAIKQGVKVHIDVVDSDNPQENNHHTISPEEATQSVEPTEVATEEKTPEELQPETKISETEAEAK